MAATHSHPNGVRTARPRAGKAKVAGLKDLAGASRQLPRQIQAAMKTHPTATLAAVAAGSFVIGALAGSSLGRVALAAALPILLRRALEGDLKEGLSSFASSMLEGTAGPNESDA